MGQQLSVRTRSTISVASTALPKSMSLSMQNCLASPCLPSSISCWNFVSFIFMFISFLCLARDGDRGLLADLWRVDLNHVAGLDGRDRILVQLVHGRNLGSNGAADIEGENISADDGHG